MLLYIGRIKSRLHVESLHLAEFVVVVGFYYRYIWVYSPESHKSPSTAAQLRGNKPKYDRGDSFSPCHIKIEFSALGTEYTHSDIDAETPHIKLFTTWESNSCRIFNELYWRNKMIVDE